MKSYLNEKVHARLAPSTPLERPLKSLEIARLDHHDAEDMDIV